MGGMGGGGGLEANARAPFRAVLFLGFYVVPCGENTDPQPHLPFANNLFLPNHSVRQIAFMSRSV